MTKEIKKVMNLDNPIPEDSLNGYLFSNENKGHKFIISCTKGGELQTLTGSVTVRFMRANNTTILLGQGGSDGRENYAQIVNGNAEVTLHPDCYNVPGRFKISVFNISGDTVSCIYVGVGTVSRTQNGELIDSGEIVPSIDELVGYIDDCIEATRDAEAAADHAVRYDVAQTLTDAQKEQARTNIDASSQSDVDDLKSASDEMQKSYAVGFNHYDGRFYTNKVWVESGTATLADATGYTSTGLIPVGTTSHKRFRANQQAYIVIAYDSSKQFVRKSNYNAYAVQFEQNGYVAFVFQTENFDSSTLMVAYTDETGGATSNTWNTLFPNQQYEPYKLSIDASTIDIDGTALDDYPLGEINDKMPKYNTETINSTLRYGYITSAGYIYLPSSSTASGGYYITDAIALDAGQTLTMTGGTCASNISAIANASPNGDVYTPLVVGDGGSTFTYTATEHINVRCSCAGNSAVYTIITEYADIIDKVKTLLPSDPYADYIDLAVFESLGVVGDSYASGELAETTPTYTDHYNISWGQILARHYGISCTNFSKGGLNTRTWLTDATYGLALLNSETAKDIYICALGINDATALGTVYLGTSADIGTDTDSFYGNYSKIIESIKTKAPDSAIIMLSIAGGSTTINAFNEAIETIADAEGVMYINQNDDPYISSATYTNEMIQGHPRAMGYARMATAFAKLLQSNIANNYNYYKNYMK